MNKHQVIDITAKILGIYMAVEAVLSFKNFFWAISIGGSGDTQNITGILISSLFSFTLFAIVAYYLIRKSDKIADKVLVSEEDQNKIELNISQSFMLDLAIIIIGGVLLAFALPQLAYSLYRLLLYFLKSNSAYFSWGNDTIVILQAIIGFYAITNYPKIRKWIVRYQDKNDVIIDEDNK